MGATDIVILVAAVAAVALTAVTLIKKKNTCCGGCEHCKRKDSCHERNSQNNI